MRPNNTRISSVIFPSCVFIKLSSIDLKVALVICNFRTSLEIKTSRYGNGCEAKGPIYWQRTLSYVVIIVLFRNSGTSQYCRHVSKLMLTDGRTVERRSPRGAIFPVYGFMSLSTAHMICGPGGAWSTVSVVADL